MKAVMIILKGLKKSSPLIEKSIQDSEHFVRL
jgi:hypothetical protein